MTALTAQLTSIPYAAQLSVDLTNEPGGNQEWWLQGNTVDGSTAWEVRGGKGLTREGDLILLDPDVPLEVPVFWTLVTPSGQFNTDEVVVPGPGKGWGVFGTTTGRNPVAFKWVHTLDEQELIPRMEKFPVSGRSRPAIRRDEVADAGGGTLIAQTEGANTRRMINAVMMNEPMSIRTHGYMLDWPLVEHIVIDSAPFLLAEKKLARDWEVEYTLTDFFALSSRVAPPITVGETAALGLTVGEVAATGLTVGEVAAGGLMV